MKIVESVRPPITATSIGFISSSPSAEFRATGSSPTAAYRGRGRGKGLTRKRRAEGPFDGAAERIRSARLSRAGRRTSATEGS
ncbi:MAG TPA: hypothetical protein VE129_00360, partial [Thermoanaerobaculia bacterium]|nr:hypothetical protein [Thermoanaerobaculia bacterium]